MTAQELKNSILQLAVQGKLVDYHKEHKGRKVFSSTTVEETGVELLERIRAEKDISLWKERRKLDCECSVMAEVQMLQETGFANIQCVYECQKFAVIAAVK